MVLLIRRRQRKPTESDGNAHNGNFDTIYVSGSARRVHGPITSHRIQPLRIRRTPPLFPPSVWNVHDATLNGNDRTNNILYIANLKLYCDFVHRSVILNLCFKKL